MNSAQDFKKIRVLIIEDDEEVRGMVSSYLKQKGYGVVEAVDGPEGLRIAGAEKFHVILLDLKMPQMNGTTVLEHLRKMDPSFQVIITTGHGSIENAVQAMKMGASDYLIKPFNFYELEARIHKAAEKTTLHAMLGLYEAGKAVFSTVKQEELVEIVMDLIWKTLKVDQASLMLVDEEEKLYIAASRNLPRESAQKIHLSIADKIAALPSHEKKNFLLVENFEEYERFKDLKGKTQIGSAIVCPLVSRNQLLGVLNLSRVKGVEPFSDVDLNCAVIFASQVAMAVQNSVLYQTLERKVTEIETMQKHLLQAEKLASLGRFASGVAHEINNPLTSVIGFAHLFMENKDSPDAERYAKTIYEQAKRCGKIVQDLLVFSRSGKNKDAGREWFEVRKFTDGIIERMSAELNENKIKVKTNWPDDELWVNGIASQIKILIENVIQNAIHALDGKLKDKQITISGDFEMGKAVMIIEDNGCGIDPEIAGKIFDPFFSGKEIGKGAGLGLSLCHSIAESHGGSIRLGQTIKDGAVFILEFPAVRQMPTAPEFQTVNFENRKSILVVEDESAIRDLLAQMLGYQYELMCVSDGEAALEVLQRQDFDAVICDYKMPRMDGIQLFESLKVLKPHLLQRFVFLTGSARSAADFDDFAKKNAAKFLLKPFLKQNLIEKIESVIRPDSRKAA